MRRAGLVRRGDARRRGRPRDGARRERPLRRRPLVRRPRPADAALNKIVDKQPGRHHHQLVGRHRRGRRRPTCCRPTSRRSSQAALEGIGVFFSSGDDGDDSLDTTDGSPAVDFPSTEPLVTAVGGTEPRGQRRPTATGSRPAGRRARSALDPTTATPGSRRARRLPLRRRRRRQRAVRRALLPAGRGPGAIAHGHRATPDIAMDGDPQTGMLVGETQTFPDGTARYGEYRIGGTQPGVAAVRGHARRWPTRPAATRTGSSNPAIYRLAGSRAVHDVSGPAAGAGGRARQLQQQRRRHRRHDADPARRSTTRRSRCTSRPGWDNLTGVGTPNDGAFVAGLAGR